MGSVIFRASQVALVVNNTPANAGDKRCRFDPWVGKIPWRRAWQSIPVFLPGESHGHGVWWATVHRVTQSWTQLKQFSMHNYIQQIDGSNYKGYVKRISLNIRQVGMQDTRKTTC